MNLGHLFEKESRSTVRLRDLFTAEGEPDDRNFAELKKAIVKSGGEAVIAIHPFYYSENLKVQNAPKYQEYLANLKLFFQEAAQQEKPIIIFSSLSRDDEGVSSYSRTPQLQPEINASLQKFPKDF